MKLLPNDIAVIEGDTHISKWVEQSGRLDHDQNTLPLLRPYIRPGSEVIDIGAFIGDHTVFYASIVGEKGHVYAFEPNVTAFQCLKHNTRHCNIPNTNVQCILAGASDRRHHASMAFDANAGASYMREATQGVACYPVDMLRLQDVSFIKIDCEGYEPAALRGLIQTIELCQPAMLIEVNDGALQRNGSSASELLRQVGDMGYKYRNVYPGQECAGPQYDIIAIPLHREWVLQ